MAEEEEIRIKANKFFLINPAKDSKFLKDFKSL